MIKRKSWQDYQKEIADDHYYYARSCIRQNFFPGSEKLFIDMLRNDLGKDLTDDPLHSSCTGIGYHSDIVPLETIMTVVARQFALASEAGYENLAVSCITSFGIYTEILETWQEFPELEAKVREHLFRATGREFRKPKNVSHASDIIFHHREAIRQRAGGCDAVLVGCGLGRSPGCDGLVRRLLDLPRPLVLDADGINALSGHMDALSRRRNRITVLTPHEGEFVRAGGDLSPGRERAAADFAREHGVYLVLKGPGTIAAAPDGRCMRNPTGNCGMAKGGSGDVLAGMLVSLLGLGLPPMDACCAAVWLHGRAGDLAAREVGLWGMTPSDLLDRIPAALREVTE